MVIGLKAPEFGFRDYTIGNVYFIGDGENIKIGYSGDPYRRLDRLQTSTPKSLDVIAIAPGTIDDEQRLHRLFDHLRVRGEWFRPAHDLLAYIDKVKRPGAALFFDPDVIRRNGVARACIELRAWGRGQPIETRNRAWVLGCQMILAAKHPKNATLKSLLANSAKRFAEQHA